ncbi:hypothetical protein HPB50_024388 [Hyalomma asiaticum]|uniref:Uncharacterized protein n=1 Tax=Hyalomma asiaticum TaxID=266040 RepID=A0ACB7S9L8_HYAAI|nr:hypothetical protein HPB50_024388 [Hyalomma asiaticum]
MKSMIETAMDQILTKVMTTVPAMVSKHISDNLRLLRRLGPVKDVSRPSKINCSITDSENEGSYPAHSVISPLTRKFNHKVSSRPPEIATELHDMILQPTATDTFDTLTSELTRRTTFMVHLWL